MTRPKLAVLILLGAAITLGGCASTAPFGDKLALAQGPSPEVTGVRAQGKLACVASRLTKAQRSIPFGVIAVPDRTGKANFAGNDATGSFNTQGAADMIVSSLGRTGVRIIDMSAEYRANLDWIITKAAQNLTGDGSRRQVSTETMVDGVKKEVVESVPNIPLHKGVVFPVRYVISGAIDSTDFIPGGGVSGGAYGVTAGYNQNRAHVRIDLRVTKMPVDSAVGGEVIATTTVEKQMVNDSTQVSLSRYFGAATPQLINFSAGADRREAWQLSTGNMLDLGVADLLEQVYHINACSRQTIATL